jgi:hypothetical protein
MFVPHLTLVTKDEKEMERLREKARQELIDMAEKDHEYIVWSSMKAYACVPMNQGEEYILEVESTPKRELVQSPKKTL